MISNRRGSLALTSLVILAVGCHSIPLRTPIGASNNATETKWLKDYRMARAVKPANPAQSCELYRTLAADKKFPARDIAALRAWETCPQTQSPNLARKELPPWLQDMGLDIALTLAAQSEDKTAEMELSLEKSKQKLPQSKKLKYVENALKRAQELKLEDKTVEITKRMQTIAPRLNPAPSESQWPSVASDFRMARKFTQAREYYEKIIKHPRFRLDDKVAAFKGIRLSYKNARDHEAHVAASQRLVDYLRKAEKLNPKSRAVREASYDAEVYLGRAVWTLGRSTEAKKIFSGIEKRLMGKVSLAELYWLKGRMAEEDGDLHEVSKQMELALNEKITDQELRDKILWYSAWNERRQNNMPRAAQILTTIDENTKGEFTRVRALFWLGRTYTEMGLEENARAVLERLVDLDPVGYYGLLARRQLEVAVSFKRPGSAPAVEIRENDLPIDPILADWLALLDEREALGELLDQSISAYRKQKDQSTEGWIALFRHYAKGGLYSKLYEHLSALPPERRKSIVEIQPELLFPQPWLEEVKLAGLQSGVDEELIYAIMRQESAFDPQARSPADAFGLMQILPEIAEPLAGPLKLPYSHMEDLYNPATNIRVGAAHLRDLLKRHKGQFVPAVASYNASEKAISTWMKTRFRGDTLEFIEEIPYEETRTYVRLVMRNLIFYSLLKSRSASIEFPAWVLKLDSSG